MPRLSTCAAVVLAVLAVPAAVAQAPWSTLTNTSGHFTIDLPVTPQVTEKADSTPDGPMTMTQAIAMIDADHMIVVIGMDMSQIVSSATADQIIENALSGGFHQAELSKDSETNFVWKGATGRAYSAHSDLISTRGRVFLVNRHIAMVGCFFAAGTSEVAECDRALNSIAFQ